MPRTSGIWGLRTIVCVIAVAASAMAVLTSCEEEKKHYVKNIGDGEHTPTLNTINVETFISDSGYTKYFIKAPLWSMYEEAKEPFWLFPQGVDLEQYDTKLKQVASMRCDSAKYLSQKRIWRLDGNVVMVNTNRDSFLTKQLFWDQAKRKVYTDSFIHIVRQDRIIEGMGFTSNEQMTAYTIKRPMGIFPVGSKSADHTPRPVEDDSLHAGEMNRGYAPPRASFRSGGSGSEPISHDSVPAAMRQNPAPKKITKIN